MPDFYPQSRISRNGSGNNSRGAYVGLHENSAEYVRLSGEPVTVPHLSGGEIAADVRTGTPQGTGGETVRHGHGMSGEPIREPLRLSPFRTCPADYPNRKPDAARARRTLAARSPQTAHRNGTGGAADRDGREPVTVPNLSGETIRTASRPAARSGAAQGTAADRDGREPVRRERAQGRAVAARFRRNVAGVGRTVAGRGGRLPVRSDCGG